jgi:hypothetical protein
MAITALLSVIYIIIATDMKPRSTSETSRNISRTHWLITIVGIVTAVAGSLVIKSEMKFSPTYDSQASIIEMPAPTISDVESVKNVGARMVVAIF